MSLYYTNGFFPFCIQSGNPWDGTTYFTGVLFSEPSLYTTGYSPVVGPGTPYPIGMNIQNAATLYWYLKNVEVSFYSNVNYSIDVTIYCPDPPNPDPVPTPVTYTRIQNSPFDFSATLTGSVVYRPTGVSLVCPSAPFEDQGTGSTTIVYTDPTCDSSPSTTHDSNPGLSIQLFDYVDSDFAPVLKYQNLYYPYLTFNGNTSDDVSFGGFAQSSYNGPTLFPPEGWNIQTKTVDFNLDGQKIGVLEYRYLTAIQDNVTINSDFSITSLNFNSFH